MNPSRPLLLALILISLLTQCKRETFKEPDYAMNLRLIDPSVPTQIVAEPLKEDMILWDANQIPELPVEGFLDIEYRDEYYQYIQLKCVPELKCNGSSAYVPVSLSMKLSPEGDETISYWKEYRRSRPFILVPAAASEELDSLQRWLQSPEKHEIPAVARQKLAVYAIQMYLDSLPAAQQERKIASWYYLTASRYEEEINPAFAPFFSNFRDFQKIRKLSTILDENGKPDLNHPDIGKANMLDKEQIEFLDFLAGYSRERFAESLNDFGYDFPFLAKNNQGLAQAFNSQNLPLYREKVVNSLLQETEYYAIPVGPSRPEATDQEEADKDDEEVANTEDSPATDSNEEAESAQRLSVAQQFSTSEGLSLRIQGNQYLRVRSVKAAAAKNGLSFEVELETASRAAPGSETSTGEEAANDTGKKVIRFQLVPKKESSYLMAARAETLQKYKSKSDEEIMEEDEYRQRLFLSVLKYGEGQYDRRNRKFQYVLRMDKPAYWKILAIVKSNEAIDTRDDSTFSGPLNIDDQDSKLRWAQHYDKANKLSELKLHGQYTSCERECWDEKVELACFDNTASSYIVVEFPARALSGAAKPEILFVHEDMNAHYFMEQLCSQALGVPLQREFKDWIALGHAPSTRSLLASRGGFPVSGNKSGTPLEPDWNGVSLVSLAP